VYVGDGTGIDCLDSSSGRLLVRTVLGGTNGSNPTPGPVNTSPAVSDGSVFAGSGNSYMFSLNALTGAIQWQTNLGTTGAAKDNYSSPAVANGVVYVGTDGYGQVFGLSEATGAIDWDERVAGNVESSPAVVNGTVYAGSDDDNLYAFDLAGGNSSSERPKVATLRPNPSLRVRSSSRPAPR
jgi:outer membrane protein assembly factor BamB